MSTTDHQRMKKCSYWLRTICRTCPQFRYLNFSSRTFTTLVIPQYEIRYKSSTGIANAHAFSRLPLQYQYDDRVEEKVFNIAHFRSNCHPVSAKKIAKEAARDKVLS